MYSLVRSRENKSHEKYRYEPIDLCQVIFEEAAALSSACTRASSSDLCAVASLYEKGNSLKIRGQEVRTIRSFVSG